MGQPTIGFRNGDLVCKNITFDYTTNPQPSQPGVITADAQLLIGCVDTNPMPNIAMAAGNLICNDGSVTIGYAFPDITLSAPGGGGGGGSLTTLTPDVGGAINPVDNNINVFGIPILAGQTKHLQTETFNVSTAGNPVLQIKAPNCCLFIVDKDPLYGTHTTIQSAINDATLIGRIQYIFIRPGVYVEDLNFLTGVSLVNYSCDQNSGLVEIQGQITVSPNVNQSITNIKLFNRNGPLITIASGPVFLTLINCTIFPSGATGFSVAAGCNLILQGCTGNIFTNGVGYFNCAGAISFQDCIMYNTLGSPTQNTITDGTLNFLRCTFQAPITSSGTCNIGWAYTQIECGFGFNVTCYRANCNISSTTDIFQCEFTSGTATAIICGPGNITLLQNCTINSVNASGASGSGELRYTPITFSGLTTDITTSIQTPTGSTGPRFPVGAASVQILSGAGAPTMIAPKGSLYLRSDGSAGNNRAYINTNGASAWTALLTVL